MGDRGNIAVLHEGNQQVWLYSHWGGYDLPARLQAGLSAAKGRWSDYSYATKIIFGHAVPLDNWHQETGYGISTSIGDNEHPILVVDLPALRVFIIAEEKLNDGRVPASFKPKASEVWSFQAYVALAKLPWGKREVAA